MYGQLLNIYDKMKERFLKKLYPFIGPPALTDFVYCTHCNQKVRVGDFKAFKDDDDSIYICCPNAPECDGNILHWWPIEQYEKIVHPK